MNQSRILTELNNFKKDHPFLFYAKKVEDSNSVRKHYKKKDTVFIECGFPGPNNDLYKDSYYTITLVLYNYPYDNPTAFFNKKVFHPNIYDDGMVCLDLLSTNWKPTLTILDILNGLRNLLEYPNPGSPANCTAGTIFSKNKKEYEKKVKANIKNYHLSYPWDS